MKTELKFSQIAEAIQAFDALAKMQVTPELVMVIRHNRRELEPLTADFRAAMRENLEEHGRKDRKTGQFMTKRDSGDVVVFEYKSIAARSRYIVESNRLAAQTRTRNLAVVPWKEFSKMDFVSEAVISALEWMIKEMRTDWLARQREENKATAERERLLNATTNGRARTKKTK